MQSNRRACFILGKPWLQKVMKNSNSSCHTYERKFLELTFIHLNIERASFNINPQESESNIKSWIPFEKLKHYNDTHEFLEQVCFVEVQL